MLSHPCGIRASGNLSVGRREPPGTA